MRSDLFIVGVSKAQATVAADVELILGLNRAWNLKIRIALLYSLGNQLITQTPYDVPCFDGDGWVYVPTNQTTNTVCGSVNVIRKRFVRVEKSRSMSSLIT